MHWIKRHIAVVLFIVVILVGFISSSRIGPAWDEPDNMFSGGVYVNFFRHGLDPGYFQIFTDKVSAWNIIVPNDHSPSHLPPLHNYLGDFFILAAQAIHIQATAPNIIIAWHLATVIFFGLLVATTYRFGILLGLSQWASVAAALMVFLYPQLFGHGLSNSKDIAQAAMFILALYYLVKKQLVAGAVLWGMGLATKFNVIYVPVIWGVWAVINKKKLNIVLVLIAGLLTMFVAWPFLWFDPVGRLKEMVTYFLTVGRGYPILWNGILYPVGTGKSLWWYPWASLLLTTPLTLLALILVGIAAISRSIRQKPILWILPIWILVPLVRTVSPWTAFYDQLRHFLEIIPAFMLMAAFALDWVGKKWPVTGVVLGLIAVGHLLFINIMLFPYSTGYYNVFAGDPNIKFDRDIEGLSIKEGMDWAHASYGHFRPWVPIAGHLFWYYMRPTDQYVFSLAQANTVILINKQSHRIDTEYLEFQKQKSAFTLVHTIRRGEAIFGWVYRRTTAVK